MLCIIRNKIKLHNFMYLPLGCLNRAQLCILPFSSEEVVRTLEISKYQFSILCIETLKMNNCKSLRKIGTFYEKFFNFNKNSKKYFDPSPLDLRRRRGIVHQLPAIL